MIREFSLLMLFVTTRVVEGGTATKPTPLAFSFQIDAIKPKTAASTSSSSSIPTAVTTLPPATPEHQQHPSSPSFLLPSNPPPLWHLALAGGLATILGDAAVHPMDCIKTLQQSDAGSLLSFSQASQLLYQEFGLPGFYKGLGTYLFTDGLGGSLKFVTYESLKSWYQRRQQQQQQDPNNSLSHDDSDPTSSLFLFFAAAVAFLVSSVVLVPGEFLKQQLQSLGGSLPEALQTTLATSGVLGLFTGYRAVLLRDIPYTMLELGLYDCLKATRREQEDDGQAGDNPNTVSSVKDILAAATTGGIAGFWTTPLDTIKTKLMVDHYENFVDAWVATTSSCSDWSALFVGATARVAWLVPFTAIYLPLFDIIKQGLVEQEQ